MRHPGPDSPEVRWGPWGRWDLESQPVPQLRQARLPQPVRLLLSAQWDRGSRADKGAGREEDRAADNGTADSRR